MLHPRDVAGAHDGGADRIFVVDDLAPRAGCRRSRRWSRRCARRPTCRSGRCSGSTTRFTTTGGELTRLVGLGEDYLAVGAEGVSFGFLTRDLTVDVEVCRHLADALGVPWTFHRAIDASLETSLAWRQLRGLPRLDAVLSAGSSRGMEAGHEELTDRAVADPGVADLLMAGGGLRGEHVPWLVRAGVRQFQVGLVGAAGRLVEGARRRRRTSGRGGCCSTTPPTGRRDGPPGDAAHRPAELPGTRSALVAPGQRHVVRGAAPLRAVPGHPAARLRPRPLRHPGRAVRRRGRRRCRHP